MNPRIEKWLNDAVSAKLPGRFGLQEVAPKNSYRVFKAASDKSFAAFVLVQTDDHFNTFTVEIAWSDRGTFPPHYTFEDDPSKWKAKDGGLIIRIGRFVKRRDFWWKVSTKGDCMSAMDELIGWINEFVWPYLQRVASEHGASLPSQPQPTQ